MTLLLSNDEVVELLRPADTVEALETAYLDVARERAMSRPRAHSYFPRDVANQYYMFKSMEGGVMSAGVMALRISSEIVAFRQHLGNEVRVHCATAPGNRWCSLILLFSMETGEPLLMVTDGQIQRMRVAGTAAVAAKYLARHDATIMGLLGAGFQAEAHVLAAASVRKLERVRVYAPTKAHREEFAVRVSGLAGVEIEPVDSAEQAIRQADLAMACTNACNQVMDQEWFGPGMYVGDTKHEIVLTPGLTERCDRNFIHTDPQGDPILLHVGQSRPGEFDEYAREDEVPFDGTLADVVSGKVPGRGRDDELISFRNNVGLGIQFAAVGAKVLELARARGVGREIPVDWFLQDVHP